MKMTKEDLDALINKQVADILKAEDLLDVIQERIAESLRPIQDEQKAFKADLMSSLHKATEPAENKGQMVGRLLRALAAGKMDPEKAAKHALKHWNDERVAKALSSSDSTAGGFLLQDEVSNEVIELLRAVSVVRSLNPVIVPVDSGTLRIPKMTAGAGGGWIGENEDAPVTEQQFGGVTLSAKKYASLVPISNDLLRRASVMVDNLVRDDLVADVSTATDLRFIRGVGTDASPKGLRYQAAAANVFDRQKAGAGSTLAEITADLVGMIQRLGDANVRMLRPGWIMEWRTWARLYSVRDGNGNLVFAPEMARGTLMGVPYRRTSQIPRNLGGGSETELYFADFADVLVGETTGIMVDTSGEAAYNNGGTVVAAFSRDQTVIRAIVEVDLAVRHPQSVAVLTAVDWSPADA